MNCELDKKTITIAVTRYRGYEYNVIHFLDYTPLTFLRLVLWSSGTLGEIPGAAE